MDAFVRCSLSVCKKTMRLIDADAYIKYCDDNCIPLNDYAVNAQPTVDAVPVVRCKDCVHFAMFKDSVKKAGICKIGYGYCIENNFCSYGVRKDDSN